MRKLFRIGDRWFILKFVVIEMCNRLDGVDCIEVISVLVLFVLFRIWWVWL